MQDTDRELLELAAKAAGIGEMLAPTWEQKNARTYWYVSQSGEILGEVHQLLSGEFMPSRNNRAMGRYATLESAKAVVESRR